MKKNLPPISKPKPYSQVVYLRQLNQELSALSEIQAVEKFAYMRGETIRHDTITKALKETRLAELFRSYDLYRFSHQFRKWKTEQQKTPQEIQELS